MIESLNGPVSCRRTLCTTHWPLLWPMLFCQSQRTVCSLESTAALSHAWSSPAPTRSVEGFNLSPPPFPLSLSLSLSHTHTHTHTQAELLVLMDQIQRDVRDKRSLQHVKKAVQALKESRGDTDQGTGEKVAGTELENEEVAAVEEEEEEVDEEVELEEMSKAGANEGGHRPDRDSTGEVEKTCDDDDTIVPATPSPAVSSTQPQTPAVSSAQPHSPAVSSAQPQTPAVSSAQPQIPAMDKTPATKSTAKRQRGKRATRESAKGVTLHVPHMCSKREVLAVVVCTGSIVKDSWK